MLQAVFEGVFTGLVGQIFKRGDDPIEREFGGTDDSGRVRHGTPILFKIIGGSACRDAANAARGPRIFRTVPFRDGDGAVGERGFGGEFREIARSFVQIAAVAACILVDAGNIFMRQRFDFSERSSTDIHDGSRVALVVNQLLRNDIQWLEGRSGEGGVDGGTP